MTLFPALYYYTGAAMANPDGLLKEFCPHLFCPRLEAFFIGPENCLAQVVLASGRECTELIPTTAFFAWTQEQRI